MVDNSGDRDDEIGLLDLLVTIAENWLLLVLVPLLAGIAAYGFLVLQPQTWRSSAVVGLPQAEISHHLQRVFASEEVALPGIGVSMAEIEPRLTMAQGSTAARTRLELTLVDSGSPALVLGALLDRLSAAVEGGEIAWPNARTEARIEIAEEEIALRERLIDRLTLVLEESEAATSFDAEAYAQTASALNEIMIARDAQQARYDQLAASLASLPATVIEEGPSPPIRVGPSPLLAAGLTVLGTGFVLLVLIFVRSGLRNAAADPETRNKIDRIRRAFWLGPSRQ